MTARRSGRPSGASPVVVRLTEEATADLRRLIRKDPQIARWALKKMLLLERDPEAGRPLLGSLMGWRKLTVSDRDWRVIWRVTHDRSGRTVVTVAEVWAVGARSNAQVYDEMSSRVARIGNDPLTRALADVIATLGRVATRGITLEPEREVEPVPSWLVSRLTQQAGMAAAEVRRLTPEEAMESWEAWMRSPRDT